MSVEVSEAKFRNMELSNGIRHMTDDPAGFTPLTLYLVVKTETKLLTEVAKFATALTN